MPAISTQRAKDDLRSLCLVRLSALGDVVMVTPLIKMLLREWPELKITWVIGRSAYPLVASLETLGVEFVVIEKPRRWGDYEALRALMKGRCFDALLCLQASWRANLIYPCIQARRKIGYGRDRAKDLHAFFIREKLPPAPPHIVDGFLQFGEAVGGRVLPEDYAGEWGLAVTSDAAAWADSVLPGEPWLAVSPCASKSERDWPMESYARVIEHVWRQYRVKTVLLGGGSLPELNVAKGIKEEIDMDCSVLDLTGRTSLAQWMVALSRCRILLAPDTGAVHVARAFARPVVGLYGVAPASRTGPFRATEYCVDKFAEAVRLTGGAHEAARRWSFRVHDPLAMALITTADVVLQVDRAMAAAT